MTCAMKDNIQVAFLASITLQSTWKVTGFFKQSSDPWK